MKAAAAEVKLGGVFEIVCMDRDGRIKWRETAHNLVTNEGLNQMLNVQLHGTTQVSPWYVGLKGAGTVAAGDTLASHAGWSEITDYTGDRQEYVEAEASSQSITNSANKASFAITGTVTVAGAFLATVASGTAGILLCAVDFSSSKNLASGDTLDVTYTIPLADDGV